MVYVGIDWADDHHEVCMTDEKAVTLAEFQIPHSSKGFTSLHAAIAQHHSDPSQVLVALETSRGLLVYDLLCQGYHVYTINPKAVNRYKDRHVCRPRRTIAWTRWRKPICCAPTGTGFNPWRQPPSTIGSSIGCALIYAS